MLVGADEYTEKYMEENPDVFPEASVEAIFNKIKAGAAGAATLQEYAISLMKALDTNNDGFVSLTEFCNGLESCGVAVTRHEAHALLRRCTRLRPYLRPADKLRSFQHP